MRGVAVAAGIVTQSEAHSRIFFVTEGEASVHYCMFHANLASQFEVRGPLLLLMMTALTDTSRYEPNVNFVVCNAGRDKHIEVY